MRSVYAVLSSLFLTGLAAADFNAQFAQYRPHIVVGDINDKSIRKELKLTKAQETTLDQMKAARDKIWQDHVKDIAKVKYEDKNKDAKLKALEEDCSKKLFESLGRTLSAEQMKRYKQIMMQYGGMMIFDEKEVRDALKLTPKEADKIKAAYRKSELEVQAEMKKQKLSPKDAEAKYGHLLNGVPKHIRDMLSTEQRKAFDDLVGEPFVRK